MPSTATRQLLGDISKPRQRPRQEERINNANIAKCQWVVTAKCLSRGGKTVPLLSVMNVAVAQCGELVRSVFVFDGRGKDGNE